MKRGSEYARRVKQLHQQMLKKFGPPELPEPTDPIKQLIVGLLAENSSETRAAALFERICEQMVDLNELRVTPPMELAETIGSTVPLAREKSERICRVLNEIRLRQDALDLSFLKQRGRREAREYLESLEGVGLYAAASVMAHSLGGHAIPVDYLTIYVLRKEGVVDDEADQPTVQSFLERHVPAAEGRVFALLLNRHVSAEGARVTVSRLPDMLKLAPPEPPKPLKRYGMEKPVRMGPGSEEPGLADLEGLELEPGLLIEPEIDLEAEGVEEAPAPKPGANNSGKKSKKPASPPPPPATPARKGAEPARKGADHGGGKGEPAGHKADHGHKADAGHRHETPGPRKSAEPPGKKRAPEPAAKAAPAKPAARPKPEAAPRKKK
jgi:endonuclease III